MKTNISNAYKLYSNICLNWVLVYVRVYSVLAEDVRVAILTLNIFNPRHMSAPVPNQKLDRRKKAAVLILS